jgi:hypothetical protein
MQSRKPKAPGETLKPEAAIVDLYEILQILLDQIQCYCDSFNGTGRCPVHAAEEVLRRYQSDYELAVASQPKKPSL